MSFRFIVVSLPHVAQRRAFVARQFEGKAYSWGFFDAHSAVGTGLVDDKDAQIFHLRRRMYPAESATYSSHFHLLQQVAKDNFDGVTIITEDDVMIDLGFDFDALTRFQMAIGIDYLRLYSRSLPNNTRVASFGIRSLIRFHRNPNGLQAYAVTRAGARRLVDYLSHSLEGRIIRTIDDELDRFWGHGLAPYAIYPYPVIEMTFASQILSSPDMYRFGNRTLWQLCHFAAERFRRMMANRKAAREDRDLQARSQDWFHQGSAAAERERS